MRTKSVVSVLCVAVALLILPVSASAESIGDPNTVAIGQLDVLGPLKMATLKAIVIRNSALLLSNTSNGALFQMKDSGVLFDRPGASFIDNGRIGASTQFRVSNSTKLDTTAMTIAKDGVVTMGANNVRITNGNLTVSGTGTVQILEITGGSDLSENFKISRNVGQAIEPGTVVTIDPALPGGLTVSDTAYDKKVAGIVSGAGGLKTGMTMGQSGSIASGKYPVALTGRVYCKADATMAAIQPGDLLTTSAKPGHAMKVLDHEMAMGAIIGKAMTPLAQGEEGLVLVLVSLQ